jgi:ribosome biogenesis GTPase A
MSIQWFPGHMTKAQKAITEQIALTDVILEVVDARMPRSSENPLLADICKRRPRVIVLSKSDLADPAKTPLWLRHYEALSPPSTAEGKAAMHQPRVPLAVTMGKANETRDRIVALCKKLATHPSGPGKTPRVMIVGIPNVGKSTLANILLGRVVAKTGNEPAVTKAKQQITLPSGITLSDFPGLMWPKIDDDNIGMRLALGGTIADNALDYETLGLFAAKLLAELYPQALCVRYKLDSLPEKAHEILTAIGKKRGCLERGGVINLHKAGDVLVHDFRNGALGKMTIDAVPARASNPLLVSSAKGGTVVSVPEPTKRDEPGKANPGEVGPGSQTIDRRDDGQSVGEGRQ